MSVDTSNVTVVIPSRNRPARLRQTIGSLFETAPGIEIVLVLEPGAQTHIDCVTVYLDNHQDLTTAALWNEGARVASGQYLVTGADDVIFLPGWLEAAMSKMQEAGGTGVIAFNDNEETFGSVSSHFLVSRDYAIRRLGGVLFPPVYEHGYTDVEVTWRAARDQRLYFAHGAKLAHSNPDLGTGDDDEVYKKGRESRERDRLLFDERKAAGFPDNYESVLTGSGRATSTWGRVAVGLRSYKFPEPMFLDSWTNFLLSGLRPGDRVLEIQHGQPNHVAANKLASDFLTKTDCDSILFIDDDMTFHPSALSSLRDNLASVDYDVVMGFCTFKTPPPHAVVYKLAGEQPGMPQALAGEKHNALAHVPDNTITDVDAVGMAFTLVRRHVFEALVEEHGPEWTVWFDWGKHSEGEDIRFSRRCRDAGFRLGVDSGVKIGHIGRYVFGWNEHQQFVEQLENKYG